MKSRIAFSFLLLSFCIGSLFADSKTKLERVEPAFWWAGMKNPNLQLLVYGKNISTLTPTLNYEGVSIEKVIKVKSPNYLFIDLLLNPSVKPGKFDINFQSKGKTVQTYNYSLLERGANSSGREGFNTSDVMYLITPDRFANGNPDNDSVDGLIEKADRKNKGGRHGGDIKGLIDHLDYFKEMGFTAIWVNPVLENNQETYSYHGYSTTDYYKVDARFGSNEEYSNLAKQAKDMGIKLIMDMIVNHCGSGHWWMNDLPTDDWINFDNKFEQTNHRREIIQDPYASDYDSKRQTDGWFVRTMPDLNQRNDLMANYLIQNTLWWIEYAHLAGIRMDTYPYPDMHFMTRWTEAVMDEYPNFNIVGEEWTTNPALVSYWQKGKINPNGYTSSLRSLMDFPMQGSLANALLDKESQYDGGFVNLYRVLTSDYLYPNPYDLVVFPDNHDMARFYTQVKEDFDLYKQGLAYLLTTRGIPQIYYGTEILMTNTPDNDHGIIRSDFVGGWEGDKINAFTGKGLTDKQKEAKEYLKKLLTWRKNMPVIHDGKLKHFAPENGVYVLFRYNDDQTVMLIMNKNKKATTLNLKRFEEAIKGAKNGKDVISGKSYSLESGSIALPNNSALILTIK